MITIFTVIANDFTAVRAVSVHAQPFLLPPTMSTGWISLSLMRSNVEQLVCKEKTTSNKNISLKKEITSVMLDPDARVGQSKNMISEVSIHTT